MDFGPEAFVGLHVSIAKTEENGRDTVEGGEYGGAVGEVFEAILDIALLKRHYYYVAMMIAAEQKTALSGRTKALELDKADVRDSEDQCKVVQLWTEVGGKSQEAACGKAVLGSH